MAPAPSFSLARARVRLGFAGAVCALVAGCGWGRTVTLGAETPAPYHFGAAKLIAELASTKRTDNPTLTGDQLEIFFTSDRDSGNGDVWSASRASVGVPFDAPAPVIEVNSSGFETSSAISADGLTLWFGSDRAGGVGLLDVWVSTRPARGAAWSTPVNVLALNSPADDIPRPPGQRGLVMPLASSRVVQGLYWTYLAARRTEGAPFGAPVAIPELSYTDRSTVDAFLTDDGLTMFFSSGAFSPTPAGDAGATDAAPTVTTSDLYVAWRRTTGEAFSDTQPLTDLNTAAEERDPWLSPDGRTLYFTSDRDGGVLAIYSAPVLPR
jgi:hypothetical protein